jgi:predicted enzyme related to lactoylglutathione lyase
MASVAVWFDVPVLDLDRAIRFYSAVLGQPVQKHEGPGFAMGVFHHEGEGIGGCLFRCEENGPSDRGILLYFNCEGRLDEAVAAVEPNGGKVLEPRESIAPHGFRAIALDSEGNRIALHEHGGPKPG